MSKRIKLARVDERALHATVALNWNRFINANCIIVVDSHYQVDPFLEKVISLSLPKNTVVKILRPEQCLSFVAEESSQDINLILIFKSLAVLEETVALGLVLDEVQLPYPASKMLLKKMTDYFSPADMMRIQNLKKQQIKFYFQTAPFDVKDYGFFK